MNTQRPKILVGIDFEALSESALERAKTIARGEGAELVLVHVFHPPAYAYGDLPFDLMVKLEEEIRASAVRSLEALAKQSGGLATALRVGEPASEILALADEIQPSMIVVGTHGRRGLERFLLGSVAHRILAKSRWPVLVVPDPAGPRGG